MVIVFASLVLVFSDLSLGAALVQREKLTERRPVDRLLDDVGGGPLFTLVGIAALRAVAAFYGEPEVQPLFVGALAQLRRHGARRRPRARCSRAR